MSIALNRIITRAPRSAPPSLQARERYSPQQNRLLASLSADAALRLFPHLELVALPLGEVLYDHAHAVTHVHFPIDAIVARLYVTDDGGSAATSIVGNNGLIGIALLLGGGNMLHRVTVQCAGYAWRIAAAPFMAEFNRHGEVFRLMLRYTQSVILQSAQTAVCNRHHSLEQQLCRLLLLLSDASASTSLPFTHDRLASLLGVRREGITVAARNLQKLAVIHCTRGHVRVQDWPKLEALSCECYAVVQSAIDRLLPPDSQHAPLTISRSAVLPVPREHGAEAWRAGARSPATAIIPSGTSVAPLRHAAPSYSKTSISCG